MGVEMMMIWVDEIKETMFLVHFRFQPRQFHVEKIVKIEVNGVEADFHTCLDNSGEAYFIKEVAPEKDTNINDSLESKQDDFVKHDITKVEVHFRDDNAEITESDSEKRFFGLQDEQSSTLDELYDNDN